MQIERRFSFLDAGAYGDIAFVTRLIAQGPEAEDGEGGDCRDGDVEPHVED